MAELTLLAYRSGSSILHRVDARFKLLFVVMIGLACAGAAARGMAAVSLLFVALAAISSASIRPTALLKSLRWAFLLLGVVFAARALAVPGDRLVGVYGIEVSAEGLREGILVSWRLLMIILAGVFLSMTTRTGEVRDAVQWLLTPLPGVPAARIATMMGLLLRFLPLVFDQARENAAAQRARGIENRKNPLYRLRMGTLPLLRRSFQRADELAVAMEARCYSERHRLSLPRPARQDWFALAVVGGVCLAAALLR